MMRLAARSSIQNPHITGFEAGLDPNAINVVVVRNVAWEVQAGQGSERAAVEAAVRKAVAAAAGKQEHQVTVKPGEKPRLFKDQQQRTYMVNKYTVTLPTSEDALRVLSQRDSIQLDVWRDGNCVRGSPDIRPPQRSNSDADKKQQPALPVLLYVSGQVPGATGKEPLFERARMVSAALVREAVSQVAGKEPAQLDPASDADVAAAEEGMAHLAVQLLTFDKLTKGLVKDQHSFGLVYNTPQLGTVVTQGGGFEAHSKAGYGLTVIYQDPKQNKVSMEAAMKYSLQLHQMQPKNLQSPGTLLDMLKQLQASVVSISQRKGILPKGSTTAAPVLYVYNLSTGVYHRADAVPEEEVTACFWLMGQPMSQLPSIVWDEFSTRAGEAAPELAVADPASSMLLLSAAALTPLSPAGAGNLFQVSTGPMSAVGLGPKLAGDDTMAEAVTYSIAVANSISYGAAAAAYKAYQQAKEGMAAGAADAGTGEAAAAAVQRMEKLAKPMKKALKQQAVPEALVSAPEDPSPVKFADLFGLAGSDSEEEGEVLGSQGAAKAAAAGGQRQKPGAGAAGLQQRAAAAGNMQPLAPAAAMAPAGGAEGSARKRDREDASEGKEGTEGSDMDEDQAE